MSGRIVDKSMFKKDEKSDTSLYIAGWCILAVLLLLAGFTVVTGIDLSGFFGSCAFHALTGLYCPGCGGTRAMRALFAGKFTESFFYHPFVPYIVFFGTWFMISQTVERIFRGRIKVAMHFREVYIWGALAMILINFVVKNLALFIWHVDFMPQ